MAATFSFSSNPPPSPFRFESPEVSSSNHFQFQFPSTPASTSTSSTSSSSTSSISFQFTPPSTTSSTSFQFLSPSASSSSSTSSSSPSFQFPVASTSGSPQGVGPNLQSNLSPFRFNVPTTTVTVTKPSSLTTAKEHYDRGCSKFEQKDLEAATKEFEASVKCFAGHKSEISMQASSNLGYCYFLQKRYTKALELYEEAMKCQPNDNRPLQSVHTVLINKINAHICLKEESDKKIKNFEERLLQREGLELSNVTDTELNTLEKEHEEKLKRIREEKVRRKAVEDNRCKICWETERTTCYIPCGHVVSCEKCASNSKVKECPICRKALTGHQKIFF